MALPLYNELINRRIAQHSTRGVSSVINSVGREIHLAGITRQSIPPTGLCP